MDKEFSNIRIVDIAKMAGVSVGTVDRVIHNRGRVSEENRKKVQTILEMVHYQPNLMARSLASKKQYHFVAITPSFTHGEYWEAISDGIDKAASEMESYRRKNFLRKPDRRFRYSALPSVSIRVLK